MRNLLGLLMIAAWRGSRRAADRANLSRSAKASLTGCVDERDGQYVLTNDTNLQPTARLKPAAGSPEDNFARHMGQKVTVRGVLSKADPLPGHHRPKRQNRFRNLRSRAGGGNNNDTKSKSAWRNQYGKYG